MSDTRDKAIENALDAAIALVAASRPPAEDDEKARQYAELDRMLREVSRWHAEFYYDQYVTAAVAARPLPDRETIAAFLAGQNWSSEQRFDRRAFWFAKADAVLSLFTTDTTEEN